MASPYPPPSNDWLARWAASGAMALTGTPNAALGPPSKLVPEIEQLGRRLAQADPLALLGERAALFGLHRRGSTSCGGHCRLFRSADGWMALSLARPEDHASLSAWLGCDIAEMSNATDTADASDSWKVVESLAALRRSEELLERGNLLGLAVAALDAARGRPALRDTALGTAPPRPLDGLVVVDLSALWAGPLCGDLLARRGAHVIKVESVDRPDGARDGAAYFFDLLNGSKRSVALDLGDQAGRHALRQLIEAADVVIESARPRALEHMGIAAADMVAGGGPQVWISITGYGREADHALRVAFGDDAAVGGGLVVWEEGLPRFCADAVADPLSGLFAAAACLDALEAGGRWLLDVAMAAVAAEFSGPTLEAPPGLDAAEPRARPPEDRAPHLGADTSAVFAELGL
jgi:hypothetical protein